MHWQAQATDGPARAGWLDTPHGRVPTPCFMAVGTQGALKGVTMAQARALDQGIILANTYHLALRPGPELVHELGGLHRFCAWDRPMLTDSGGYQVFSLARQRRIDESGVTFRSHHDGASIHLSPEESIRIQRLLGADIIMAMDECPPIDAPPQELAASVARTGRWLERSIAAWQAADGPGGPTQQALYGIVQGGLDPELRRASLASTIAHDLPGYAIGGLAVGEAAADRQRVLDLVAPGLPADRPRYLMGVGTPLDLVEAVARGIDQFDCVLPTRMARHGIAYTDDGPRHLKRAQYATDPGPIDADTPSEADSHARGQIRHLFKVGESLAGTLVSIHNLAYYRRLMERCRTAIIAGNFTAFADAFRQRYQPGGSIDERSDQCLSSS